MSTSENKMIAGEMIKAFCDKDGYLAPAVNLRSSIEHFFSQLKPLYFDRQSAYTAAIGFMVMNKFEECYRIYYSADGGKKAIRSAYYWARYQQAHHPEKFGELLYIRIYEFGPKKIAGAIPGTYLRPEGLQIYTWINCSDGGPPGDVGIEHDFSKGGEP